MLGGLIKLAAVGVKAHTHNARGVARNAAKADGYLGRIASDLCFGLAPAELRGALADIDAHAAAATGNLPVWLAPGTEPTAATAGLRPTCTQR